MTFGYHLDETDPHVSILRRLDGTFVAAFGAHAAAKESIVAAIVEAAGEDCRDLTRIARRP